MQTNITIKIQKAIETLRASHIPHSKSIFYAESIDSKMRAAIARWYAPIASDENILLFTNKIFAQVSVLRTKLYIAACKLIHFYLP